MTILNTLFNACAPSQDIQQELIEKTKDNLSLWDHWLLPIHEDNPVGDDPTYGDDFQLMREEINKISGIDPDILCKLAENIFQHHAKDLRVATWYIFARLLRDGEKGLSDGLVLLTALLTRFSDTCHPHRLSARKAALEWLNSAKVLDCLLLWPEADKESTTLITSTLWLLNETLSTWPESEQPDFSVLCQSLESRLARSGGAGVLVPQNSKGGESSVSNRSDENTDIKISAVQSGRDLLDQSKILSRWLIDQPDGWLASHRLMKTVRWDTVNQIPPLDENGRTRLLPPKAEYRAQLKRLYLQQSWVELIEQASSMFCESVNHFNLDLQWYLWQGLIKAGQPWELWADYIISDLQLLLKRLPGIETLTWNDGSPFADEATLNWIAEKVNDDMQGFVDEPVTIADNQDNDVLILEAEAMEKGDTEGPEAALIWLQNRTGMDSPRNQWLLRLLMARVAEQYGRNEMALHLLGELTSNAQELTLNHWEPALLFEVQARRLKLLRIKSGRSESDKARYAAEMEKLLAGLIAIDPARAMILCN